MHALCAAAALAAIGLAGARRDVIVNRSARVPQSNAPSMQNSIPDSRLILLDTRARGAQPQSADGSSQQPSGGPPSHNISLNAKDTPAPQPAAPKNNPPQPKADEKKGPAADSDKTKPEPPKQDARAQPKAAVPQATSAPQPKAAAPQPPVASDDNAEEDYDDGPAEHEGGPPAGSEGNKRAAPTGRRDFKPVRGGDHKPIKPKRVGFQYLRDMFTAKSSAHSASVSAFVLVPFAIAMVCLL